MCERGETGQRVREERELRPNRKRATEKESGGEFSEN